MPDTIDDYVQKKLGEKPEPTDIDSYVQQALSVEQPKPQGAPISGVPLTPEPTLVDRLNAFDTAKEAGEKYHAKIQNTPAYQETIERGPAFPRLSNLPYSMLGTKGGGLTDHPPSGGFEELGSYVPLTGPVMSQVGRGIDWAMGNIGGAMQRGVATGVNNLEAGALTALGKGKPNFIGLDNPQSRWEAGLQGALAPLKAALNIGPSGSAETELGQLGYKPVSEEKPALTYDEQGNLKADAGQMVKNIAKGGLELALNTAQDPLMAIHPGLLVAGKVAKASRMADVVKKADASMLAGEEFVPRNFTTPSLAERAANGEVGVRFGIGKALVDVPAPAWAMKPLDAISEAFKRPDVPRTSFAGKMWDGITAGVRMFQERNPNSVEGIAQRLGEDKVRNYIREEIGNGLMPMQEALDKANKRAMDMGLKAPFDERVQSALKDAVEIPTPDGNALFDEIQSGADKLVASGRLAAEDVKGGVELGRANHSEAVKHVQTVLATLGDQDRATAYSVIQMGKELPGRVREGVKARFGADIPELGASFRKAPLDTMKQIDVLDAQIQDLKSGEYQGAMNRSLDKQTSSRAAVDAELNKYISTTDAEFKALSPEEAAGHIPNNLKMIPEGHPAYTLRSEQRYSSPDAGGKFPAKQPKFTDEVRKLEAKRDALIKELPSQIAKAHAVPDFVPGRLSPEARAQFAAKNPNLGGQGVGGNSLDAQRGYQHSTDMGTEALEGVPFSTRQMNLQIAKGSGGTASTAGRAVLGEAPNLYERFLSTTGLDEVKERLNPTFMKGNLIDAWKQYFERDVYKTARNAELDNMYSKLFKQVPDEAIKDVQKAAHAGIADTQPGVTRPPTLEELNSIYRQGGGIGKLQELMRPDVFDSVNKGEMSVADAFKSNDGPFGMKDFTTHDGRKVWMHEGMVNELEEFKRLADDPVGMNRYLRMVAQPYQMYLGMTRKLDTSFGPQSPSYQIRNALGDWYRRAQANLLTPASLRDEVQLLHPLKKHLLTGKMDSFEGRLVDLGEAGKQLFPNSNNGIVPMANAVQLALDHGLDFGGQMRSEVLSGASKASKDTGLLTHASTFLAAREAGGRIASFWEALRQGDSPLAAAYRVEHALFNMRSLSPAARFMRDWGVSLFSWPFKNIPFQVQFAMEHPGITAATMRAQEMVENGDMPDHMLPAWLKNKTTWVSSTRNEEGHVVHSVKTPSGLDPTQDFHELRRAVQDGNLGEWIKQSLGPLFQQGFNELEYQAKSDTDKQEQGRDFSPMFGRGGTNVKKALDIIRGQRDRFGNQHRVMDAVNLVANPLKSYDVDVTQQAQLSRKSAEKDFKSHIFRLSSAEDALTKAIRQAETEQKRMNEVVLLGFTGQEMQFHDQAARVERAKHAVQTAQLLYDKKLKEADQAEKTARALMLAP